MSFSFNFTFILVLLTVFTGLVAGLNRFYWAPKRGGNLISSSWIIEECRSLFPVFLLVLILRSFVFELYRIPSGSLKPTLINGDLIAVSKFDYALRLPLINTSIFKIGKPKTGDIVVFHWPVDPSHYDLIKRVIGVPGDHISYINKKIYLNGKEIPQKFIGTATDNNGSGPSWPVDIYQEDLAGTTHKIYLIPSQKAFNLKDIVVPPHMYFMMGDNRDNSEDSRYWGFVPEKDIVGKAVRVILNWDNQNYTIRWNRLWLKIKGHQA